MPFTFVGLVFVEVEFYCYKIEWLFCGTKNFLSMVLTFFGLVQCHGIIVLFVVIEY